MSKFMLLRRFNYLLGLGLTAVLAADTAFGQGFGGPGGGFGGPGGSGFSDYLLRKDENHNGVLDPEEWQNSRSRYMIENAAKEAGIDLTRPIPIDRLQAAMNSQREKMGGSSPWGGGFGGPGGGYGGPGGSSGWGRPPESSNGNSTPNSGENRRPESRRDDKKSSSLPPGVPGFGEKVDIKPVLGFGSALDATQVASATPLTKEEERAKEKEREREREKERKENRDQPREERRDDKSSGGRDSGSRDSGSASRDKEDFERREREKNRETAKSMVAQNDTNKDGHLAKRDDEWKGLRGTPENADYNKDGIITVDELTERLMERSRETYASSSSRGGYGSKPTTGTNGKPVRFLTATERLPEGLPSWFTRGDLNGDGQVSMGEYATKWDDAKITEFMKFDMNSDGMITANECIAVEKARGGSTTSRTASTMGALPAGGAPANDKAAPASDKPVEKSDKAATPSEKPSEATAPVASASE
jgi:hypothetical protein